MDTLQKCYNVQNTDIESALHGYVYATMRSGVIQFGVDPPSCLLTVFIFVPVTRELNISGDEHGMIFPSLCKMEESNPTATRISCYFER